MKRFELMGLNIRSFKGMDKFNLSPDGKNVNVKGGNATGKTTLFDSFVWLLFGKDSQNKSDFEIKPVSENVQEKENGMETEVEGIFKIYEKELSLKRVYFEKFTKQRGSAHKVSSGNTTKYFVDGVPSKKKEFDEKVNEIISEDVFKLLTNPLYFNEQLHWKQRREILLEIAGGITDEEIVNGSDRLEEFVRELNGRDVDDYIKIIQAKMKEINNELIKIPVRMDEISIGVPEAKKIDKEEIEEDLNEVEKELEERQEKINSIANGGEISNKKRELANIEYELTIVKNNFESKLREEKYEIKNELSEKEYEKMKIDSEIRNMKTELKFNEKSIVDLNKKIEEKRNEWRKENKKEFLYMEACECPTCGQDLPKEQVEEAKGNFNKEKSINLENIQFKANEMLEEVKKIQVENNKMHIEIENKVKEIEINTNESELIKEKIKNNESDINDDKNYQSILKSKYALKDEISVLEESTVESIDKYKDEIKVLETERKRFLGGLETIRQVEHFEKRKEELKLQEKELAMEYEKLEKKLYLSEEFMKRKVDSMESKINEKFKYARFKLFDEQQNGGVKPTCITTYKGVPYSGGLNNAMKINIGLDIITTLIQHYKVAAPIFIDNRESVIKLIDMDTQIISLLVENINELQIEKLA